jgi:hypothetical protein
MMFVMFRVSRNTRFEALLTSTAGPSPLAFTTVFSGTRKVSIMARIVAEFCGYDSSRMLFNFYPAGGLTNSIARKILREKAAQDDRSGIRLNLDPVCGLRDSIAS